MTTNMEWQSSVDDTTSYLFVSPTTAGDTTGPWTQIRVPQINVESWTHVEEPYPGGRILAEHLTEPIKNLRKEFNKKLELMMNQIMERVMEIVLLMPRRGGMSEIPIRAGAWCICGHFISEEKKLERCEYCGK